MDFKKIQNLSLALIGAALILTGPSALAADGKEPCPDDSKVSTTTPQEQKTSPNPTESQQTGQDSQSSKMVPPGAPTPPPFKMMDPKKDGG